MTVPQCSPKALDVVQEQLLLCAVRALIETHPDAVAFRESWAQHFSLMTRDHLNVVGPHPELLADINNAYRILRPVWESYFPDSRATFER